MHTDGDDDNNNARLIDDCFFIIFEYLELPDLMNLAQVNADFYYIALYEFKRKYSDRVLDISDVKNAPKPLINQIFDDKQSEQVDQIEKVYSMSENNEYISIRDYSFALKTIKYFGCVLKHFEMNNKRFSSKVVKNVFQHLNKHSVRSLVQLIVGHTNVELLGELKGPFPELNDFTYIENDERPFDILPKRLAVSEKFPNLRRFSFWNTVGTRDTIFPIEHIRHLEYVNIEYDSVVEKKNRINKFLKQNSHIRQLDVAGFPKDYIVKINSLVPNLVELAFETDLIDIKKPIHFEHMTSFNLRCVNVESLGSISFGNLQEFQMIYNPDTFYKYNEFFRNNRNLTRFTFEFSPRYYYEWENQVAAQLDILPPSVVEITLNSGPFRLKMETIVSILGRRENLMKFKFMTRSRVLPYLHLENELGTKWNITTFGTDTTFYEGLELTRKNQIF